MNSFINDSDVNKVVYDDADNKKFLNGDDKDDNKFNGSNVIEEDVMIKVSNFLLSPDLILMVTMKMST